MGAMDCMSGGANVPDTVMRAADTAAASSILLFGFSLSQVNEVVQIIAGLVAIIAGLFAIAYHWKRMWSGK